MKKTSILRKMLQEPGIIVMPGAYDCLSAKLIEKAGFRLLGVTGAGICASVLGVPDLGLATMSEILDQTKNIVNATTLPVIADCDNGYGNPINVMRTIREFENIGVAGLWIEDQVLPKRCGHFKGKKVISREEMIMKINAAVNARKDPDLIIMARCDARAEYGLEETISRAKDYVKAGADMIFVEAPETIEELQIIGSSSIGAPLMVNLVEGGRTPLVSVQQLQDMGVKVASFSGSAQKVAIKSMQKFLDSFYQSGDIREFVIDMVSLDERSIILDLPVYYDLEKKYTSPES